MTAIAAIDEEWPDGNDLLESRWVGSCQSGRSRLSQTFSPDVTSEVLEHDEHRVDRGAALLVVQQGARDDDGDDRHPDRPEGVLDPAQEVEQRGVVVGPVLRVLAPGVDAGQRVALPLGHEDGEHGEESREEGRPREDDGTGTV